MFQLGWLKPVMVIAVRISSRNYNRPSTTVLLRWSWFLICLLTSQNVVRDGIQNILYNRYTPMILPSFQDDGFSVSYPKWNYLLDIMELTLIAARLKTMGLNASAAAISGECGEVLDTKAVSKYYTNYSPGMRLLMPNMERKECKEFVREKIHYQVREGNKEKQSDRSPHTIRIMTPSLYRGRFNSWDCMEWRGWGKVWWRCKGNRGSCNGWDFTLLNEFETFVNIQWNQFRYLKRNLLGVILHRHPHENLGILYGY